MEFKEGLEPVSPYGHYFNSSKLSVSVIGVFESEVPINLPHVMSWLEDVFLPNFHPRFSSLMFTDEKGEKQWKRVEVKLEDHVNVPIIPTGLTPTSYDEYLDDFISNIAMGRFPPNKPLWEFHIFNHPTSNAAGTIIIKVHHVLGDGYSLMSALLSCVKRADNPSLPLTLPSRRGTEPAERGNKSAWARVPQLFSLLFNTASDFGWSVLKSTLVEDDRTPIRYGNEGAGYLPITLSSMTFSLDLMKHIKTKLGVTVNDIIVGLIFFGTRLCMQEISHKSSNADSTALVLLNTRKARSYKSIKEMVGDSGASWGNKIAFLHVPIPKFKDPKFSNPLEYVLEAQKIIKRRRTSLGVYLTDRLLDTLKKLRGPEAAGKYVHGILWNSSMTISNMIGPAEQVTMANHPLNGFYFMTPGLAQNLTITIVSYRGNLRVTAGIERGGLDPQKFKSCVENAFEMMLKAADEVPKPKM
ncbi:wax ester synthase/diacylglycerol acyltransferase 11-like [Alnus glutinosa]|uniref:wax ester synthase/diacylglycerol acyltransferase 11-like n=1 Tax=Alnus glutinosa TaxID=3517 RepID=UPI002D77974E|nr:wax ester synthase/diacylglycerol acyltransferase 11-like [Alnus glutinosa]